MQHIFEKSGTIECRDEREYEHCDVEIEEGLHQRFTSPLLSQHKEGVEERR